MTTVGKTILALAISSGLMELSPALRSAAALATQTAPGGFVDVEGSKRYYEECGTGPEAVILLHDGIVHSAVGRRMADVLQAIPYDSVRSPGLWPFSCRDDVVFRN